MLAKFLNMIITRHIFSLILALALFFPFFVVGPRKADASHCYYTLSESGCTISYTGTCSTSDCSACLIDPIEYAADGTVCATSPNSCDDLTCSAINTITKCQAGKCNDSQVVSHPWSVCSSSTASCTPTPTVYIPPPTVYIPPPTVYIPPPTIYVPPPTVAVCPIPSAVTNVVVECPYCQ